MPSVWVFFSANHAFSDFEERIRRAAKKAGGRESGSGTGMGERDMSFDVKPAKLDGFKQAVREAAKGTRIRIE